MSGVRTDASGNVILTANGVDAVKANVSGVITAGAQGVSGLDVATVNQVLGIGQTWQSVTRSLGTIYTNSTGRTIVAHGICAVTVANASLIITVGGVALQGSSTGNVNHASMCHVEIPNGVSYSFTVNAGVGSGLVVGEYR